MGESLATWEMILLGLIGLAVVIFFVPGMKHVFAESEKAKKDWPGFLLPVGAVILFVIVLIVAV